jgi:acetyl esterase/lipase
MAPDDVDVELRVVYGVVDGRELTLDLFTPKVQPSEPRPAIVFLHGGCWWRGDPSQFHYHAGNLASRYGFFAVSVDYRLSQVAPFPAALQDAKCAVRWIRSRAGEYNVDPERIAVCGGSAGGHLSSMMLTTAGIPEYEGTGGNEGHPSHVNLGILFNGEFDMWDLLEKGSLIEPMRQFMGGTPEECPERYDELSSVKRIHGNVPPVLLLHGTEDTCVSHEQSVAFHERLREVGVHSELEIYPGKPHAWFNSEPDRTVTTERMERFLVEQFGLKR